MRKNILFHAFVILTVAFALGLVTGIAQAMDHASTKAWLVSHVTGILVCLLMSVVGLLWTDLRLGPKSSRVLYWSTVPANYVVMLILGVLAPALGASPGIVVPEAPPPTGGLAALVASGIIIATITSFVMSILVVVGLREKRPG